VSDPAAGTAVVLELLLRQAPELGRDGMGIDPDADLGEDLGLDSVDVVRLMEAIRERTGVEIPPRRYPFVRTLRTLAAEVAAASGGAVESREPEDPRARG
jgi:acyl carrier protein